MSELLSPLASFTVAAGWLLTFLVHSSILLLAVALFERLRRDTRPAVRELLWRTAILGALVTATLQSAGLEPMFAGSRFRIGKSVQTAALPALADPGFADFAGGRDSVSPLPALAGRTDGALLAAAAAEPASNPHEAVEPALAPRSGELTARLLFGVALIWLAGGTLALLRLAGLAIAARNDLRRRAPAGGELVAELEALSRGRVKKAPTLSIAPELAAPVALPGGEIVLPAWAAGAFDRRQRRAVLAHELAHQIRRDPWWIAALVVLQAILWPQPLLGVARRRLARLAELEADAWAARSLGDARAVAECLADCAERMLARRAPLFGAAMADRESTPGALVHRIDRLLEGDPMPNPKLSKLARAGAAAAVLSSALFLPGCDVSALRADFGGGSSIRVSVNDDGMTLSVSRSGYRLKMHAAGKVTFLDDESDVATIAAGGKLTISEKMNGVERAYKVRPGAGGALERSYEVDGDARPLDDEGKAWVAAVLPRVFRETGYDAEARVLRLFKRGGAALVLSEVELMQSDWARGQYLGALFAAGQLPPADLERAIAAMETVDSDYEMRQMLDKAIASQKLDGVLFARLLRAAAHGIDSDYEMAELLIAALDRLPADTGAAEARKAWSEAAATLDSDYELGRAIGEAFERASGEPEFVIGLVGLAAREVESDYELRQVLERTGARISEPGVAAACLAATRRLESSYERSQALIDIAGRAPLDATSLGALLDSTAEIEGNYERLSVLQAVAAKSSRDPEVARRYRELARGLGEFERGQALAALDDAAR